MAYIENPNKNLQKIKNFLSDEVNNHIKGYWFEAGIYYPVGSSADTPEYYYTITIHREGQQKQMFKSFMDGKNVGEYGMMQRFINFWADRSWKCTTCGSAGAYAHALMQAYMDTDSLAGDQHKSRKARYLEERKKADEERMKREAQTNQVNYTYSMIEKDLTQAILRSMVAGSVMFDEGWFTWREFESNFNMPETAEVLEKLENQSNSDLEDALNTTLNKVINALVQRGIPMCVGVLDGTWEDREGMLHYDDNQHLCYHKDFADLMNIMFKASNDLGGQDERIKITRFKLDEDGELEEITLDYQACLLTRLKHDCKLEIQVDDDNTGENTSAITIECYPQKDLYIVEGIQYGSTSLPEIIKYYYEGQINYPYVLERIFIKGTDISLDEVLRDKWMYEQVIVKKLMNK